MVLGCTHYPMLAGLIGLVMGDEVTLVSSADETAKDVYRVLTEAGLLRPDDAPPPEHRFLATGDQAPFARLAERFLGRSVPAARTTPVGATRRQRCRGDAMKLTVLGCAGSFPGPDSACSAYLVEADGFRLLLDFGTGSLSALQRYASLTSVDAILLTHLHADHVLDACSYVVVRRYAPDGPYPPIPVYAPAGARERLPRRTARPAEGPLDDVYTFSRPQARHLRHRPVHGHGRPGQPPGGDVRRAAGAQRPGSRLLGRHRAVRGAAAGWPRTPTSFSARRATSTATTTRRTCT